MAQTIFANYMHIVFSTKNRFAFILPEIENELYGYIGGIVNNYDSKLIIGNGTANHVHLLVSLSKHCNIPDLIGDIKRGSSKWIKSRGGMLTKFGWQDGYFAFSVGHTQIPKLKQYISNQKSHHKQRLFKNEMRAFFVKYDVEYDEKYVWG